MSTGSSVQKINHFIYLFIYFSSFYSPRHQSLVRIRKLTLYVPNWNSIRVCFVYMFVCVVRWNQLSHPLCRFSLFLVGRNRRVNFEEKVTFSMSRYERCVIYSESNDLSNDKPFHAIFINLGEKNRVVPLSWVKCWNLKNLSTYPQSTLVKIGPCSSNLCYPNLFIHLLRLQLRKCAFP